MADNVIRTITIRGSSEGLDKLTADIHKLAAAEKGLAVVSDDLTKSQLSLEQLLKRQTLRLDEAARAQNNYDKEVRLSQRGVEQGLKTAEEHARTVELATQRYGPATTAANNFTHASANLTKQTSRNTAEMLNLGRQVADVGVSLQAGQSILTVGIQQGAQILDVFASSGRTVGQIFGEAVGWAGRFAMSTAGIVTGVGAVAASVLYLGNSFATAQRDIDKALAGMGGASGVTRGGINRIAEQATGLGMSVSQARETATAFASTGKIFGDNILTATKLTRDFALVTGVDATEATKTFAAALADPSQGALELNKNLGFLDATTLNYIQSLQTQNKLQEAQKVMMDAINPSIQKQLQSVGLLTKGWEATKNAASNFFDDVGKGAARLGEIMSGLDFGGFSDEDRLRFARQAQQTAQERLTRETDPGASKALIQALTQAVREADAEVAKLEKRLENVSAAKRLDQLSLQAKAFEEAIIPGIGQVRNLEAAINKLEEAKAKGVAGPNADAALTIYRAMLAVTKETMEVEERKAAAYLRYGGAVGQTLARLHEQLGVAQAVGQMAQIEAQHRARIAELTDTVGAADARRIANAERAVSLAQIEAQHQQTMVDLRGQLNVAEQVTGIGQINAQYEATVASLELQIGLTRAIEQAEMGRAIALARVNAEADQQLKSLQQQGELISANTDREKASIAARHTYQNLIDKGVDAGKARAVADQQHSNALKEIEKQEERAAEAIEKQIANIRTAADAWQLYTDKVISWSVAHDEAVKRTQALAEATEEAGVHMAVLAERAFWAAQELNKFVPFFNSATDFLHSSRLFQSKQGGFSQFNPAGYESTLHPIYDLFAKEGEESLAEHEKIVAEAMKKLEESLDKNTEATHAQTDVLSPFYSSDPRRTHLGFRAFAGGGIMTAHGELPLKQYQGGGIATSPQVAVFGEGSTPEAYVPAPAGKIPVEIRQPANSNVRPVHVTINVQGNADANTVAALKATAFQQAQAMRRVMG